MLPTIIAAFVAGSLLGYGVYRELRKIDRALRFDVPPIDPRPPGYLPQWHIKDWARPCDTRPRWKRIAAFLGGLA